MVCQIVRCAETGTDCESLKAAWSEMGRYGVYMRVGVVWHMHGGDFGAFEMLWGWRSYATTAL